MSKYTAQDFENAQFAEHPDGRLAHRVEYGTVFSWSFERNDADDYAANEYMVADGWAPVPAQRTITESELEASVVHARQCASFTTNPVGFVRSALDILGITVVQDPEPTNAEKLEALLEGGDINAQWGLRGGGVMFARELAHALDEAGVKAPGGDDER